MKHLSVLTSLLCLIGMLVPACAPAPQREAAPERVFDQAKEESAIRETMKQGYAVANMHDVEAFVAHFVEDFENETGTAKGREAWGSRISDSWKRDRDVQYNLQEELGLRFVTPDVAIYRLRDEVTGSLDSDGEPLPPHKRVVAYVMTKKDNKWLIAGAFRSPVEE